MPARHGPIRPSSRTSPGERRRAPDRAGWRRSGTGATRSGRIRPGDPRRTERGTAPATWPSGLAAAVGGEVVATDRGRIVRREVRSVAVPARPGAAGSPAGLAGRGRPARLPRHGDDGPRHGGRHGRVPRRGRAVARRRVRPGPAAPARPLGRAGPARRPGRGPAARRLARHVQRARLRLAAPRGALSDGSPSRAEAGRPPRPPPVRPAGVPSSARGRPAALGRTRAPRGPPGRRRRRLGDPGSLPRLPARRPGGWARRRRPSQRA